MLILKNMLHKEILDKNYFLNSDWLQFIIMHGGVKYEKILYDLCEILEAMRQNKKIKTWFFLNKKQNILVKMEFIKKYRYELLNLNKLLKQKYKKIIVKVDAFEPEIFQFGGDKGWEIAKKYFNKISLLIIENKKIGKREAELAIITIFDLLLRAVGDSFEVWDILQRLMIIRGINQKYSLKDIKGSKFYNDLSLLFKDPKFFYFQKLQDEKLIKEIVKINIFLIHELEKNKFSLTFSVRKILPYYIIFIYNMLLISELEQKEIIKLLSFFSNPGKYK